ncbi:hypothetical protein, partial [Vibrio sp. 10N.237.312.B06]
LREGVNVAEQIVGSGFSSIELRNKAGWPVTPLTRFATEPYFSTRKFNNLELLLSREKMSHIKYIRV